MKRQNEEERLKRRELFKLQRNTSNRFQSLEALSKDAEMRNTLHEVAHGSDLTGSDKDQVRIIL